MKTNKTYRISVKTARLLKKIIFYLLVAIAIYIFVRLLIFDIMGIVGISI